MRYIKTVVGSLIAALVTLIALPELSAQVTFSEVPTPQQFFARKGDSTHVTFQVRGTMSGANSGNRLKAVLYKGGRVVDSTSQALRYVNGDAGFGVSLQLPVTRANHTLVLRVDEQVLATVPDLVGGDVFVVNGQSNAVGGYALAEVDRDSFLRGYLPVNGWTLLQYSNPGQWMGRAAMQLSKAEDVPVAVFNFAVGAQQLGFFMPGGSANYDESEAILASAGVLGRIRGLCWFQGEADGWEATLASYTRGLSVLFDAYKTGFGVSRFYGFQTRTYACSHPKPFVMEAQRRLSAQRDDVDFLASTNAVNDSCHFVYEGGYQLLGDRLAKVIRLRQYGETDQRVLSPDVDSARAVSATQIDVYFRDYGAGLAVTGRPWTEFRAEGPDLRPISGQVIGARLRLTFAGDISGARGLSYLSHAGPALDAVHNRSGVGAFTFYNVSLAPGDGAPGNRPDAELKLRSEVRELAVATIINTFLVVHNTGRASIKELKVQVPLPRPQLIYVGANEGNTVDGTFDPARDTWTIDGIAPGDSAVLQLNYFVFDQTGPATVWAQIISAEVADEDSRANNGTPGQVREDDEVRLVFNDRASDCNLSLEANEIECSVSGRDTTLTFTLDPQQTIAARRLLVSGVVGGEVAWTTTSELQLSLKLDAQTPRLAEFATFEVARADDPSCATVVGVSIGKACGVVSVGEEEENFESKQLRTFPNPVQAGMTLRLQLDSNAGQQQLEPELFDVLGRRLAMPEFSLDADSGLFELAAPTRSGVYYLRLGRAVATVLVE